MFLYANNVNIWCQRHIPSAASEQSLLSLQEQCRKAIDIPVLFPLKNVQVIYILLVPADQTFTGRPLRGEAISWKDVSCDAPGRNYVPWDISSAVPERSNIPKRFLVRHFRMKPYSARYLVCRSRTKQYPESMSYVTLQCETIFREISRRPFQDEAISPKMTRATLLDEALFGRHLVWRWQTFNERIKLKHIEFLESSESKM